MVFYRRSPRYCALDEATSITTALHRKLELCGVFVNASLEKVVRTADRVGLTMIQLHGDEGPVFCREVQRATACKVIKAMRINGRADLQALDSYHIDFQMLDNGNAYSYGGTGQPFSWEIARGHRGTAPLIHSGGLTPANVQEAIAITHPFAVDVASGVESVPGRKDPVKLQAFFDAVRGHEPAARVRGQALADIVSGPDSADADRGVTDPANADRDLDPVVADRNPDPPAAVGGPDAADVDRNPDPTGTDQSSDPAADPSADTEPQPQPEPPR